MLVVPRTLGCPLSRLGLLPLFVRRRQPKTTISMAVVAADLKSVCCAPFHLCAPQQHDDAFPKFLLRQRFWDWTGPGLTCRPWSPAAGLGCPRDDRGSSPSGVFDDGHAAALIVFFPLRY